MKARLPLLSTLLLLAATTTAQLNVVTTQNPQQLVTDVLLGGGVTASNFRYNGVWNPPTNQDGSGSFTAVATNLGLDAGVVLSSGEVNGAVPLGSPASSFVSGANGTGSDADLVQLCGLNINDRAVLEFDFIPTGDSLKFRYVFGSEEYPEFACTGFNDAFGFFLSGPGISGPFSNGAINIALVPGTSIPILINSVNSGTPGTAGGNAATCASSDPNWQNNSIYYVDNQGQSGTTVVYDGFTTVLTAFALVECGVQYHIKLAVGDGGDSSYDSAVFLEAGSFTSTGNVIPTLTGGVGITGNTMLEGCPPVELVFTRLGDTTDVDTVDIMLSGTFSNGVDIVPALPTQLIFPASQETVSYTFDVPQDGDGLETLIITIEQLIECAGIVIQTVFNFNIDSPPPLDVQTQDLSGICGDTHLLAPAVSGGMGQYSYAWNTGETTPDITVSPAVTTSYSVTVSDICNVAPVIGDFTVTLPIYPPLALSVDPPTLIDCLATGPIGVTSITGGDNDFDYEWTVAGIPIGNTASIDVPWTPSTYYTVTVTDGCGSSITDSVYVSMTPLPPISITTSGDKTVICTGDSTLMEVLDIQGGNGVYFLNWTDETGTTLTTGYQWEVGVPADHTYTITVDDQCGTQGDTTITTFIPHYAPFMLDLPVDQVLCAGDSTTIHAMVTGGSGYYHILWTGDDSLTDPLYWVYPDEDTDYEVTVTDQCGEVLTDEMTIEVEHVFTDIVVTNKGQDDWYLEAATLPYARTWVWDMGDGTRYREDEVYHSYLDLDSHLVKLNIITPNGCLGEDSVWLKPPAHIYFPNAFTPDGDAHNQFFGPVGHDITEFEMTVFDRWGEVIYTTKDINIPWDGTVNGAGEAMTGVYVYTYRAVGHYFPAVEGVGHVTLIRGSRR
jgi:gliding motility-associated-like protein